MKKIVLVLAILLCATWAYAGDNDRTISVTGVGEVEIAPDTGNLNLGFRTMDADLAKAKADMTAKMDALIDALKKFNISEKDIQATQLYIYPNYTTSNDGKTTLQGYDVSRSITVVFKDLTQTDAILDASIKAGANTFNGLSFSYSKEDELKQQALDKAIQNANNQADSLAKSFGVKRGKVMNITTVQSYMARNDMAMLKAEADTGGGAGYTPGQVKVNAQISVIYGIADDKPKPGDDKPKPDGDKPKPGEDKPKPKP